MRGILDFFNTGNTNEQKLHDLWIEIGKKNIAEYYHEEIKSLNKSAPKEMNKLSTQLLNEHNQMTSGITNLLAKFKRQANQFQTNALNSHENLSKTLFKIYQLLQYEYLYRFELSQEENCERTLTNNLASLDYTSLLLPSLFKLCCEETFAREKRIMKHEHFLRQNEIASSQEYDQIFDQGFDLVENDDIQTDENQNSLTQPNKM